MTANTASQIVAELSSKLSLIGINQGIIAVMHHYFGIFARSLHTMSFVPIFVVQLTVAGFAVEALAADCPAPAMRRADLTPPARPAQPPSLDPYSITWTVAHYYDAPFGLGFLEAKAEKNNHYHDWMFELALPLWRSPDTSQPLGWLMGGQVYTDKGMKPLTGAGMVETEYEHTSFIIWETRKEWLKLKLTRDLYVWVPQCHLGAGKIRLDFVPWQAFFRRHANWLHFRRPVPHKLRSSPDAGSTLVTTIGTNHKLIFTRRAG